MRLEKPLNQKVFMSYIKLNDANMPGITGLLQTYIETAQPLTLLAQQGYLRKRS